MINTSPPASNSVYNREKWNYFLLIMCVTVVLWSRRCLHVQMNRVRLPAMLFSVSFHRFFFLFGLRFLTLFLLLACFVLFLLLTLLIIHLDSIYFKLKSGVLFWKRDFKSSWSSYWPSLRPEKTISCQCMSLLWNSWIFFNVSLHHDKQHSTPQTVLVYTQHPPVTHRRN